MKLYISGPIAGVDKRNEENFRRAHIALLMEGYGVVCPWCLGEEESWTWTDYLKRDIKLLVDCDGVATLDGYWRSKGAKLEVYVARALSIPVLRVDMWVAKAKNYGRTSRSPIN